jgi:3alpha(or 20beta)-hydroxysteroid dehydrogenase
MLTRAAALECKKRGEKIRVSSVAPGAVKTALWTTMPFFRELVKTTGSEDAAFAAIASAEGPGARFAEPLEVAHAILFLASDESSFVTASEIVVDLGYTA